LRIAKNIYSHILSKQKENGLYSFLNTVQYLNDEEFNAMQYPKVNADDIIYKNQSNFY